VPSAPLSIGPRLGLSGKHTLGPDFRLVPRDAGEHLGHQATGRRVQVDTVTEGDEVDLLLEQLLK